MSREPDRNVVGGVLLACSVEPLTGYRDGCCATGPEDEGSHTVCCETTAEFLEFSARAGNDLSTPRPEWGFPGVGRVIAGASARSAGSGSPRRLCAAGRARRDARERLDIVPIDLLTAHSVESAQRRLSRR